MKIKDEIVCFAHLRWCHNGWASNILIVVDTGYAGIHHSKYWMPIHYDAIEDGQNKKSHLFFSNCNATCGYRTHIRVKECMSPDFNITCISCDGYHLKEFPACKVPQCRKSLDSFLNTLIFWTLNFVYHVKYHHILFKTSGEKQKTNKQTKNKTKQKKNGVFKFVFLR